MAKPTKLPEWATGASRTVEPSAGEKTTGWNAGKKPPARKMNWLQNIAYQWLDWLNTTFVVNVGNLLRYNDGSTTRTVPLIAFSLIGQSDQLSPLAAESRFQQGSSDIIYTVPAGALNRIGATIRMRFTVGIVNYTSPTTLTIRVRLGALGAPVNEILEASFAITSADSWTFDLVGIVQTTGISAHIDSDALAISNSGNATLEGDAVGTVQFDATTDTDLSFTATTSINNPFILRMWRASVWIY